MTSVKKRHWNDMTAGQQATVLTLVSLQVSLAVTAWTDLALRPSARVRGSKGKWAGIIAINFLGPILYFIRGIQHR